MVVGTAHTCTHAQCGVAHDEGEMYTHTHTTQDSCVWASCSFSQMHCIMVVGTALTCTHRVVWLATMCFNL